VSLVLEALRDLRANRARTLLGGLGMFLAIMAIVGILCAAAIVRDVFVAKEEQQNGRAVTMQLAPATALLNPQTFRAMTAALERRIVRRGGAFAIEQDVDARLGTLRAARSGDLLPQDQVIAVAGRLDEIRRLPILHGRWLRSDSDGLPPELVLNRAAAAELGGVGTRLAFVSVWGSPPHPARVVGVIADGSSTPSVFTSIASVLAADPSAFDSASPPLILAHRKATDEATLTSMLDDVAGDLGIDSSQFEVTRVDHVAELAGRLHDTQNAFLAAGGVALLVAVVGLLNIGLASVRERSRELVVRRSIGATRARMFSLVLASALATAAVACAVAVAIALVLVYALVPALLDPASAIAAPGFPWRAAGVGLAAALGGAVAGAIYPAAVAARIDMALALRD
jgi:MacB-like periplasmic core domain